MRGLVGPGIRKLKYRPCVWRKKREVCLKIGSPVIVAWREAGQSAWVFMVVDGGGGGWWWSVVVLAVLVITNFFSWEKIENEDFFFF